MPGSARTDLAAALEVDPSALEALADCREEDLATLAEAVAAMLAREDEQVEAGLRQALAAVPLPLRGRARALLLGDGA